MVETLNEQQYFFLLFLYNEKKRVEQRIDTKLSSELFVVVKQCRVAHEKKGYVTLLYQLIIPQWTDIIFVCVCVCVYTLIIIYYHMCVTV